jgi:hypothetical protein
VRSQRQLSGVGGWLCTPLQFSAQACPLPLVRLYLQSVNFTIEAAPACRCTYNIKVPLRK